MALYIPSAAPLQGKSSFLSKLTPLISTVNEQTKEPTRDTRAVQALALVAEGESSLRELRRQTQGAKPDRYPSEGLQQEAQAKLSRLLPHMADAGITQAVQSQMRPSLQSFAVRSQDLSLRRSLAECDAQERQKQRDAALHIQELTDSALNAPTVQLRAHAVKAVHEQLEGLKTARLAIQKTRDDIIGEKV